MVTEFQGRAFRRGEDGYEAARCAAVWNARTPQRYPDLIVQAEVEEIGRASCRERVSVVV